MRAVAGGIRRNDAVPLAVAGVTYARKRPRVPGRAKRYRDDPIGWMVDCMGVGENTIRWTLNPGYEGHEWDGTYEPIVRMCESIARWKDTGVEGATGTSKTFIAALLVMWFLDVWENSEVVTAAPIGKQLKLNLWAEISKLWPRYKKLRPTVELLSGQLRMVPGKDYWTAVAMAVGVGAAEESATRAQGYHAEHMLVVTEETPGIHPAVMTAFQNTRTAPHNLQLSLGNPDSTLDELHKFCELATTEHVRISAYDFPNVICDDPGIIPGGASRKSIEDRRMRLGEDSRMYKSRVRGISPTESKDALIRMSWIRAALEKGQLDHPDHGKLREGVNALGVDVANSEGGDQDAKARGEGRMLLDLMSDPCPDSNELGREVHGLAERYGIEPGRIGVDSVGVGAGTVNELKRLGMKVQALNGGDSPRRSRDEETFNNLRSQMWWQARVDLQDGELGIALEGEEAERLVEDLVIPTYTTRSGKIVVESKEDIKKRLGRSPDRGDAFVYWNWVRQRIGRATIGGSMAKL